MVCGCGEVFVPKMAQKGNFVAYDRIGSIPAKGKTDCQVLPSWGSPQLANPCFFSDYINFPQPRFFYKASGLY